MKTKNVFLFSAFIIAVISSISFLVDFKGKMGATDISVESALYSLQSGVLKADDLGLGDVLYLKGSTGEYFKIESASESVALSRYFPKEFVFPIPLVVFLVFIFAALIMSSLYDDFSRYKQEGSRLV